MSLMHAPQLVYHYAGFDDNLCPYSLSVIWYAETIVISCDLLCDLLLYENVAMARTTYNLALFAHVV